LVEIEAIAHVATTGMVMIDRRQTESLFAKADDAVMRMKGGEDSPLGIRTGMSNFRSFMGLVLTQHRISCYQLATNCGNARNYTPVQHSPVKKPFAPLAQLAEQVTLNHWVAGSIPARCTIFP
jgi:hypothetical protein